MNVLVMCIDTLRWDHCAYNGATLPLARKNRPILTPNIDRLAARSTIFDRAIIGSFPTIPMRTDCFTGNVNFPRYDWKRLGDEETILTEVLKDAGYYTGFVHDTRNMVPTNFGRAMDEDILTDDPPANRPKAEDMPFPVPKKNIRQQGKERQEQMAHMAHFTEEADWFVSRTFTEAAKFLERNAKRDKWFLWVDTFEVHEVWHTPQHYIDLYDPNYKEKRDYDFPRYGYTDIYSRAELRHMWARYAAEVTLTDRWIGYLLDQLDVMELWDDTLVVFVSDHGMYIGEHKRAGKHTVSGPKDPWPLYEEVSHIPLLVSAPRGAKVDRVSSLVQPADIFPTVLDFAGIKAPTTHGQSMKPLMSGRKDKLRDVVYSSKHSQPPKQKSFSIGRLCVTEDRWSLVTAEPSLGHKPELYDLRKDPGQTRNLAKKHPAIVKRMQKAAIKFLREQGATDDYVARYE